MRVGDDGHLEAVCAGVADGEADTVDGDGAFLDGHVSLPSHLRVGGVAEGVIPTAVGLAHVGADGRLVDVTLHDVAVQAAVHQHTALHVHAVANVQVSEVGALQCLAHGGNGIGVVRPTDDGQADTVVGDALIDLQFIHEGATQRQVQVALVLFQRNDGCGFFYDS